MGLLQHLQTPNTTATCVLGETNRSLLSALSPLFNFVETAILRDVSLLNPYLSGSTIYSVS